MAVRVHKQPGDTLDYGFDLTEWMPSGDSLTTANFSASPSGLTLGSSSASGNIASVFISAGTAGTDYTLTCTAVTDDGRTVELELIIECRETPPSTAMVTPDQVRQHVETDLAEDAIQRLIDDAAADIEARYGDQTEQTDYLEGGGQILFPSRQIGTITSITETIAETDYTLAASDYLIRGNGWMIKRLVSGANGRSVWAPDVKVVHVPLDDGERRRRIVIDLVRLALQYNALESTREGDYAETSVNYQKERERLIRGLQVSQRVIA